MQGSEVVVPASVARLTMPRNRPRSWWLLLGCEIGDS